MSDIFLVVIGGAIGLSGTVVGIAGSWRSQDRQLRHDRDLQDARFREERRQTLDDAIRERRRARLQPVMDLLDEMERYLASRLAGLTFDELKERGFPEQVAPLVPEAAADKVWEGLRSSMIGGLVPEEWPSLTFRAVMAAHRIGDRTLSVEFMTFASGLTSLDLDLPVAGRKIAELHERLEVYASTVPEGGSS